MKNFMRQFEKNGFRVSDAVWEKINAAFQPHTLPKGSILLTPGEVSEKLYFMKTGIARVFYERNGQDTTAWFVQENQIGCFIRSFIRQTPSFETTDLNYMFNLSTPVWVVSRILDTDNDPKFARKKADNLAHRQFVDYAFCNDKSTLADIITLSKKYAR